MRTAPPIRTTDRAELERLLKAKGASQADLARFMGLPESAVSNLLNGKRAIKDAELPGFSGFLGIEMASALRILGITVQEDAA